MKKKAEKDYEMLENIKIKYNSKGPNETSGPVEILALVPCTLLGVRTVTPPPPFVTRSLKEPVFTKNPAGSLPGLGRPPIGEGK